MIAYSVKEVVRGADTDVFALRTARTSVALVDENGSILDADEGARTLFADIDPAAGDRLPWPVFTAVRQWAHAAGESDLLATALPGLLVRAVRLSRGIAPIALLVERLCTRETLADAAKRYGLSPRERDVLHLLIAGDSAREIAQRLEISEYTVGEYVKRMFAKTLVRNRSEMIGKVLGWREARFLAWETPR